MNEEYFSDAIRFLRDLIPEFTWEFRRYYELLNADADQVLLSEEYFSQITRI